MSSFFAPKNNLFEDCIIDKLFTYINEDKPKLLFTISKNFPYEAGLGSASSNVASVIKILENLELIKKKKGNSFVILFRILTPVSFSSAIVYMFFG